jgi:hypothetical protein
MAVCVCVCVRARIIATRIPCVIVGKMKFGDRRGRYGWFFDFIFIASTDIYSGRASVYH